jgi:hypothetical protein
LPFSAGIRVAICSRYDFTVLTQIPATLAISLGFMPLAMSQNMTRWRGASIEGSTSAPLGFAGCHVA